MSQVPSNYTRFVEVGRVVLLNSGPDAGKIAVIAEIVDHNRAVIDGPSTGVGRQPYAYRHLTLTRFRVPKLARGAGTGAIRRQFEASGVAEKWAGSLWAKKCLATQKRRATSDFDRFKVMLLKKARRDVVRKTVKRAKAA